MAADAPPRVVELKRQANEAIAVHELDRATSLLDEAIHVCPSLPSLWTNRAYVRELRGEYAAAHSDAQHCVRIAPGFAKGHLRLGRALLRLGKHEEARNTLGAAVLRFPQDYALQEALSDAHSGGDGDALGSVAAMELAELVPKACVPSSNGRALDSSYYYAAVPASRHTLPIAAPPRIDLQGGGAAGEPSVLLASANGGRQSLAATGAVQRDIEQKGSDSYYYAHARSMDYQVPTVPKRIERDGTLSPWTHAHEGTSAVNNKTS